MAGPYAKYGTPVLDAAVRCKTHYADITGESSFMRDSIEKNHERAAREGTCVVHACGYDSVRAHGQIPSPETAECAESAGGGAEPRRLDSNQWEQSLRAKQRVTRESGTRVKVAETSEAETSVLKRRAGAVGPRGVPLRRPRRASARPPPRPRRRLRGQARESTICTDAFPAKAPKEAQQKRNATQPSMRLVTPWPRVSLQCLSVPSIARPSVFLATLLQYSSSQHLSQ